MSALDDKLRSELEKTPSDAGFQHALDELADKLQQDDTITEETWTHFLLEDNMLILNLLSNAFMLCEDVAVLSQINLCICLLSSASPVKAFTHLAHMNEFVASVTSWLTYLQHEDMNHLLRFLYLLEQLLLNDSCVSEAILMCLIPLISSHSHGAEFDHRLLEILLQCDCASKGTLRRFAQSHENVSDFSNTFVRVFNRTETLHLSCVLFITECFTSCGDDTTFFYPNDVDVIIDVVLRLLVDAPLNSDTLHSILMCLAALVSWRPFSTWPYKIKHVKFTLIDLLKEAHEEQDVKSSLLIEQLMEQLQAMSVAENDMSQQKLAQLTLDDQESNNVKETLL